MREFKGTPGPWVVEVMPSGSVTVTAGQFFVAGDGCGLARENAKLISVAPDLLSDLVEAAQLLRNYEKLHREKGTEDGLIKAERNKAWAEQFEATIAKATE